MAQTELDAVNMLLNAIGTASAPVLTTAPDVKAATKKLAQTSKDIQSVGWYFNTEDFYYSLDVDGKQALPDNALKVDTGVNTLVKRGGYLYDKISHSNVLTGSGYDFTNRYYRMVLMLDYAYLPATAYAYIVASAKKLFVIEFEGDYQKAATIEAERMQALTELQKEQLDTTETGYLTNPQTMRLFNMLPGVFRGAYS